MQIHHIKRLPAVDPSGKLIGIVSRRDLLSVFLRPDAQIAAEVRELLTEILFADPATVTVAVHGGVVTLLGQPGSQDHHDLIPVAIRLIWDIDGVVDVVDKLSADAAPAGGTASSRVTPSTRKTPTPNGASVTAPSAQPVERRQPEP
jgi:CBS domain-containing protein